MNFGPYAKEAESFAIMHRALETLAQLQSIFPGPGGPASEAGIFRVGATKAGGEKTSKNVKLFPRRS